MVVKNLWKFFLAVFLKLQCINYELFDWRDFLHNMMPIISRKIYFESQLRNTNLVVPMDVQYLVLRLFHNILQLLYIFLVLNKYLQCLDCNWYINHSLKWKQYWTNSRICQPIHIRLWIKWWLPLQFLDKSMLMLEQSHMKGPLCKVSLKSLFLFRRVSTFARMRCTLLLLLHHKEKDVIQSNPSKEPSLNIKTLKKKTKKS